MVGAVMIIKGLFRKYQRWNPVHPTSGAFWGMGLGVGCGVGWGPGFGPQVVGYVGAGCGVGFSVGITLAGFGIGLPAQLLPYKAVTRSGALNVVLLNAKSLATNGWTNVSSFHREATSRFQNTVTSLPIYPHLGRLHFPSFGPHKGSEE